MTYDYDGEGNWRPWIRLSNAELRTRRLAYQARRNDARDELEKAQVLLQSIEQEMLHRPGGLGLALPDHHEAPERS